VSSRLVLASASPRRRDLLSAAGYGFEVVSSDLEETIDPRATPEENAERLALAKALAVSATTAKAVVLAGDTVVALDNEILGKPLDHEDARRMLQKLSGSRHRVITAVAVVDAEGRRHVGHAVTHLRMRPVTKEWIDDYLKTGKSFGKAGAYAFQEGGDRFLDILEGDVDTVVGLPLRLVSDLLSRLGVGPG
jgi:septum formation protein